MVCACLGLLSRGTCLYSFGRKSWVVLFAFVHENLSPADSRGSKSAERRPAVVCHNRSNWIKLVEIEV
jgi:hypothetical protein